MYAELLAGGYTQVCEFHYLHNAVAGSPYARAAEMSLALVRAAQRTGMGLTLLPTLYMRSGFAATGLRDDQRRFASTPDSIMRIVEDVQRHTAGDARINVGVAIHSLRAVSPAALKELAAHAHTASLPVHIHIAEANLGDGVFDLRGYAKVRGSWSIGSDSHVTRRWSEELRLLEASLSGGLAASGQALGGLIVGQRADFCVLDAQSPALLGIPSDHVLDALVFSSPDARFDAVYVAGQAAHTQGDARFAQTMHALWGG